MTIYCGREFSCDEIESIRQLMLQSPTLLRTPLSRKLCELFAWTKPNGELKDMSCRVALLRMQAHGLITLPPSRMPRRGPPPLPGHRRHRCANAPAAARARARRLDLEARARHRRLAPLE